MLQPFFAQFPSTTRDRLTRALEGIPTFLIGGIARNLVFHRKGLPPGPNAYRDLDLVCGAPASVLEKRLHREGFKGIPVGKQFEVVKAIENGYEIDVTPLKKGLDTIVDEARAAALLSENLGERDLTINAMALSWPGGELIDPEGGAADIEAERIRAVGDPNDRFEADALRVLRASRFSAAYGFPLDNTLFEAMRAHAPRLADVAPERVRQELLEILKVRFPSIALGQLLETGALAVILPEIAACFGIEQSHHHWLGVLRHAMLACDLLPPDKTLLRLTALFHDAGKPLARRFDEMKGDYVFFGHAEVGADIVEDRMRALRFSTGEIDYVRRLTREHMFVHLGQTSPKAVRRWMGRLGPVEPKDALQFMLADIHATGVDLSFRPEILQLLRIVYRTQKNEHPVSTRQLAIGGKDLIEMGLQPGPHFSRILDGLLEIVLEDPLRNEREYLNAKARELAATEEAGGGADE